MEVKERKDKIATACSRFCNNVALVVIVSGVSNYTRVQEHREMKNNIAIEF